MSQTRTETDSFGPLEVPADKYWGAQTQRSILNFPIGWERQPVLIVRALGVIKQACAQANLTLGKLDEDRANAIIQAASEVVEFGVRFEKIEAPEDDKLSLAPVEPEPEATAAQHEGDAEVVSLDSFRK